LLRRYWRDRWLNIGLLGSQFVLSRDDESLGIPYETLWTADFRSRKRRVLTGEPYRSSFKSRRLPDYRSARTRPEVCLERSLPVVWPGFQTAFHRWIGAEVLQHRTQATVLDRSARLDDAGHRRGSTLGRLLEGVSHERARCLSGIPAGREPPCRWAMSGDRCTDAQEPDNCACSGRSPTIYDNSRRHPHLFQTDCRRRR
jgi:hypothetical protein